MKKFTLFSLLSLCIMPLFAQINMADSTVQVVSYWDKGEKQNYTITLEKIKLKGEDTTSKELISYDVEVSVTGATKNSYTVQWDYKNFKTNDKNEFTQELSKINKNMQVIYKTDEMGGFIEVINWKEIRAYNQKAIAVLRKKFGTAPEIEKMLKQIENSFSTKEAIEAASIKDIQQFHSFHGGKYKLHEEISDKIKVPNVLTNIPFDADYSLYLDEINETDNNYIIRSSQVVDSTQLMDATFQFLSNLAKSMNIKAPKKEDIKGLSNDIQLASRIHGTGWVVYSIQTTTVNSDNQSNIEERIIEVK
ncbi:MAG: hypothetical protein LW669_02915 [Sphingobacteriales bacterium]|nr:hypothetical protein [Sphingobacteriales bacterium]